MSKTVNKRKGDVGQAGNAGQWAALTRSESDILVDLPEDTENPPMVRVIGWSSNKKLQDHLGTEEALLTPEEVAASAEFLDEDHLLENIERTARSNCMRRGAMEHYDDVVGDTAHDLISRIRRGEDRDRNISAVATRALLARIAGGHLSHRLGNGEVVSTPTREAQKKLKARIAQIEQEEGRHVSGREVDAIADEIRMSFKPGRRPEEGFHVAGNFASGRQSLDQTYGEEGSGDTFGSMIAEGGAVSRTDHRDTTSERALAEHESPYEDVHDPGAMQAPELLFAIKDPDSGITARDVQSSVYNVIAQSRRLPEAKAGSVPHRPALAAQKKVLSHEKGASGVAQDYLDGERNEQTEALFTPFGEIDDERRRSAAEFFARDSDYSDELWTAAMRTADRERKRSNLPRLD